MKPATMTFKGPDGDVVYTGQVNIYGTVNLSGEITEPWNWHVLCPITHYKRELELNSASMGYGYGDFPTEAEALADFKRMGGQLIDEEKET